MQKSKCINMDRQCPFCEKFHLQTNEKLFIECRSCGARFKKGKK